MVPQIASLKLALLLIIIDVSWIAHAVKGTRAFITNVFLSMQAFKIIRQEKLPHVCELVNAICPPTLSCTFQAHFQLCRSLQCIRAEWRWSWVPWNLFTSAQHRLWDVFLYEYIPHVAIKNWILPANSRMPSYTLNFVVTYILILSITTRRNRRNSSMTSNRPYQNLKNGSRTLYDLFTKMLQRLLLSIPFHKAACF